LYQLYVKCSYPFLRLSIEPLGGQTTDPVMLGQFDARPTVRYNLGHRALPLANAHFTSR